jgi:uncharacterized protein (TIGR02996 family)
MTGRADDLEAAIDASIDADDPQPFLVYADWLQSIGDPRGELIVLQHRGARHEADELIAAHRERLLGPFAAFTADAATRPADQPRILELEWQLGFVHAAHIGWVAWTGEPAEAAGQLRALLELPSCRFLKHLKLGPMPAPQTMDFRALLDVLVATGRPRTLRSLFAGHRGDHELADTATGPIDDVLAAFPRLRHVTLQGGEVRIGAIDHAELRSFGVRTARLARVALDDVCAAVWPRLDRLELTIGDGTCGPRDLGPLLSGATLPSLRHLALVRCPFADELVGWLAESALLPQLVTLDLSDGLLSDAGAREIASARPAFAHLEHLDVHGNVMTGAALPLLRRAARRIAFGEQGGP